MSDEPNTDDSNPTERPDSGHSIQDVPPGEAARESWLQRQFSRMEEAVEDWGLSLEDALWSQVFRGFVAPLALWAVGIYFTVVQKVGLYGMYGRERRLLQQPPRMILTGWGVVALGLALFCFGLCLHFHYFCRVRQPRVGAVGLFISLVLTGVFFVGFIVALVQCA
jgi:hypothetical protein